MLAIYARISRTKERNEDQSIDVQKKYGIEWSKKLGLEYEFYVDEGISAATTDYTNRINFMRMIDDIENGKIEAVFALDRSRIEREPYVRYIFEDILRKNNIKFCTEHDGEIDLNDPNDELTGSILSSINKFQVSIMRKKISDAVRNRAKASKSHGILPYGYMKADDGSIQIHADEAEVVKLIFEMSLNGIGTRTIAETLQKKGILTRLNKIGKGTLTTIDKYTKKQKVQKKIDIKWSGNSVRGILVNSTYKGERVFAGMKINVPAIIPASKWEKAQQNLKSNQNNKGPKIKHKYLLKGLLRCKKCGRNYYGRTRVSKKDNYYMCSSKRYKDENCGNRSINIDLFDDFIWYRLFLSGHIEKIYTEYYKSPLQIKDNLQNEVDKLLKSKNKIKEKINNLVRAIAEGQLPESATTEVYNEFKANESEIDLQIAEIRIKIAEVDEIEQLEKGIKNKFQKINQSINYKQKQKIINDCIKNIEIQFIEGYNTVLDENVAYGFFVITVEYKIPIATEKFINGYQNDLQTWFKISNDILVDEIVVNGVNRINPKTEPHKDYPNIIAGREYTLDISTGEIIIDSIVPNGFSQEWDKDEMINFYGRQKFQKMVSEQLARREYLGQDIDSLFY